ncbi:DUF5992 family protein [Vibrio amylolyticus]|uniref:DUF5992 family protein n=1 Tax=Vibrio amylolyticus TaxID=2847292 RepID=UPI00354D9BC4
MLRFSLLLLSVFAFGSIASGTYIVKNATISSIANTSSNVDRFIIWIEGGNGVCVGKAITFPRSATTSAEVHQRAYSAALTAFTTGSKIDIHNYHGEDCTNASYIRLVK